MKVITSYRLVITCPLKRGLGVTDVEQEVMRKQQQLDFFKKLKEAKVEADVLESTWDGEPRVSVTGTLEELTAVANLFEEFGE